MTAHHQANKTTRTTHTAITQRSNACLRSRGADRISMNSDPIIPILINAVTMTPAWARWVGPWLPRAMSPSSHAIAVAAIRPAHAVVMAFRRNAGFDFFTARFLKKVKEGEQDHPQQINEVPEGRAAFDVAQVARRRRRPTTGGGEEQQHCHTQHNVKQVDPGKYEEIHEEVGRRRVSNWTMR